MGAGSTAGRVCRRGGGGCGQPGAGSVRRVVIACISSAAHGSWPGRCSTVRRPERTRRPALPGRSSAASGSPVLGRVVDEHPQRVMAEPAFERRRAAFLLRVGGDQGGVHVDDQRSPGVDPVIGGVVAGQPPCRARAAARAVSIAGKPRSGRRRSRSTVRDTVGSEATRPNTPGSARSTAISARQSPPTASVSARSSRTFAGSCTAYRGRHGPARPTTPGRDRPSRAVSVSSTAPACDTTFGRGQVDGGRG